MVVETQIRQLTSNIKPINFGACGRWCINHLQTLAEELVCKECGAIVSLLDTFHETNQKISWQ